jgi:Rps23 Pro-64 3,4-dihydroxylase Tpa1-like proline 4-hydroxylase
MPWFRLGKVERQLTAHGSGGFFAPHVDTGHPIAANRRISCVYYFYANPRRFTGGELRVYDTWVTPSGDTAAATRRSRQSTTASCSFRVTCSTRSAPYAARAMHLRAAALR